MDSSDYLPSLNSSNSKIYSNNITIGREETKSTDESESEPQKIQEVSTSTIQELGEKFSPQKIYIHPRREFKTEEQIPVKQKSLISRIRGIFKKESPRKKVRERVDISAAKVPAHREFFEHAEADAFSLLTVDKDLLLPVEELKGKNASPKELGKYAYGLKIHENVKHIPIDKLGTMVPVRFRIVEENGEDKVEIIDNQVLPTSAHQGAADRELEKMHLMNAYYTYLPDEPRAIIRTAKIDTEERTEEFFALITKIKKDIEAIEVGNPRSRFRVCSHQLNSFEKEGSTIRSQHRNLAKLSFKAEKEGIEIVHINTPSNRLYQMTKYIRKKSSLLGALAEKVYLKGEKLSKEQNLEAWGTYLKWLDEDLYDEDISIGDKQLKLELEGLKNIIYTVNEINHLVQNPSKKNARELKEKRNQLRRELSYKYEELKALEDTIKSHLPSLTQKEKDKLPLRKITLMRQVLGSQLGIKDQVLSRGKEVMMIQILNNELGITSAMNCRSGLDRTGFLHALTIATAQETRSSSFDIIEHWDETTKRINLAVANAKPGKEEPVRKLALDNLRDDDSPNLKVREKRWNESLQIAQVQAFRKNVLTSLIKHGIPVTFTSTGVIGIKWHDGLKENLIPLNFLPPFIEVYDGEEKVVVQIVEYNKKTGKPTGLTPAGHQLLTKFDAVRSA